MESHVDSISLALSILAERKAPIRLRSAVEEKKKALQGSR